jgi:hypothetical protein
MSSPDAQDKPTEGMALSGPCCRLRTNGMFIYNDGIPNDQENDYASSIYWCVSTMKSFGPDDAFVGGRECRDPNRSCYQPI